MKENKFKDFFNIENRTKYFVHVFGVLLFFSVVIFGLLLIGERALSRPPEVSAEETPDPFENIEIRAKGAIVWDVVNDRKLFGKNQDMPLPLASLTKVMTAVTANSELPDNLNIEILNEYLSPEGDSQLEAGDVWRASDLRDFTLLTSSNDGAFALASVSESRANPQTDNPADNRTKFIKAMNDTASKIGLSNSRFFNEHGLDREEDRGGAYGSAKDMALLFEYTLQNHPQILEGTRYKNLKFESAEKIYSAENTNAFVDQIPNILASKTGYTDLAGGNLVIAYDAGLNRPIIISVLGSTEEGRFEDTLKLVDASLKYIQAEL